MRPGLGVGEFAVRLREFEANGLAAVSAAEEHVLVVVHPGAGNATGTLQNGLLAYAPALAELPRSGILHRLDKDTSGLLIVAKTLIAHTHLVRDLESRAITREYRALCVGPMTAGGSVDAAISRHRTHRCR